MQTTVMVYDTTRVRVWLRYQDGVWNGVDCNRPVAVFGHSKQQALKNLTDAIESHIECRRSIDARSIS